MNFVTSDQRARIASARTALESCRTPTVFHRRAYAQALAQQRLEPGSLDQELSSGVFLSGIRRIGKTTSVRQDFIPALLDGGALALNVDLWTDRTRTPMALVQDSGELAVLAFSRIAGGQNRGLYAADTLAAFSRTLGRDISTNDMIPAIDKRVSANLIVRSGHGHFVVADPFLEHVWLQHVRMRQTLTGQTTGPAPQPLSGPS